MPLKDPEQKRQYEKQYRLDNREKVAAQRAKRRVTTPADTERAKRNRLRLRIEGLCRDCRKPAFGRVRCRECSQVHQDAQGDVLEQMRGRYDGYHHAARPEALDRRQGGKMQGALTWALVEHRVRWSTL